MKQKGSAEKVTDLQRQSRVTQEELDALVVVNQPLMQVKKGLVDQIGTFKQELDEIEKERKDNKDKINLVDKNIRDSEAEKATDKTDGYLRGKENLLNAQDKLEKRKEEVEKQHLKLHHLLQRTEDVMTAITERRKKVENHMQLIHMHLEEEESQSDKAHLHRE